jgi:hypothetical protein
LATTIEDLTARPRPVAGQFFVAGTCTPGTVLAPQERCRVDVGLATDNTYPSQLNARLAIAANGDQEPTTVDVIGFACFMDCDAITQFLGDDVQPKWLDFPPQSVGGSFGVLSISTFKYRGHIGNTFNATLRGGDSDSFRVTDVRCSARGIEPDCTFDVVFAPRVEGPLASELWIYGPSAGVPAVFSITGQGGAFAGAVTDVIEYYHAALDHYFNTALADEIAVLDDGLAGWTRTGYRFKAFVGDQPGSAPLCRLYIRPGYGDSHFYTADADECALRASDKTRFELETRAAMHLYLPIVTTGACPEGSVPVYRLWNQRSDSNHRFTTDRSVRDRMISEGYVAEGYGADAVSMCAPQH